MEHHYQNYRFHVLLAELNNTTFHVASEVYDYPSFIVMIEKLAPKSCQVASKVSLPSDDVDLYIGSPSVTTCHMCRSLSSTLGPHNVVKIAIPCLTKDPLSDFASL
jgi:hypothetical protein